MKAVRIPAPIIDLNQISITIGTKVLIAGDCLVDSLQEEQDDQINKLPASIYFNQEARLV